MDLSVTELKESFTRYRRFLRPWNRDTSVYGWQMLKGYLLLDSDRTYANIDRKLNGEEHKNGQNLQQYMSDSPWESAPVFGQVQQDIKNMPFMEGGSLNFDETGEECSGSKKAGASRQYLGRMGKIDLGQVVVLGSYYKDGLWTLVDAELFLPEEWFEPERRKMWKRLHIPLERVFKTKLEIAREQFIGALRRGLPFRSVGFDSFYGRDVSFRRLVGDAGKYYMACVPSDSQVWLDNPGENPEAQRVLVKDLPPGLTFESIETRAGERGALKHEHAFVRVWTLQKVPKSGQVPLGYVFHPETLIVRKELDGKTSFALSNYPPEEKLLLAQARSERYFVERTIQDCKSELGLNELQALKYRALMHTLALCAVALIFTAQLKFKLRQKQSPPEQFAERFPDIPNLPDLSLSNVKELLKSTFHLPVLTKKRAVDTVVEQLFHRTNSIQSRRKNKLY